MKTSKIFLSILAAVGAGAAIGLLFAPDKGVNTRKTISQKGDRLLESLNNSLEQLQGTLNHKYKKAIDQTEATISNGKLKFDELKDSAKTLAS